MHTFMLGLERLVRRRRWVVAGLWLAAVLAAAPFAARQSDRLSGGGFTVPGSQSLAVQHAFERDFGGVQASPLSAVLVPRPGATRADMRAALERLDRAARAQGGVRPGRPTGLSPRRPAVVPLRTGLGDDDSVDLARSL